MNLFHLALLYMTELLYFYCFGYSGEMKCEPCNHLLDEASVFRKKPFSVCYSPSVNARIAIQRLKKTGFTSFFYLKLITTLCRASSQILRELLLRMLSQHVC